MAKLATMSYHIIYIKAGKGVMYPFPVIVLGCNICLHFHFSRFALVTEAGSRPPDDDMVGDEIP